MEVSFVGLGSSTTTAVLFFLLLIGSSECENVERKLVGRLLNDYDNSIRPSRVATEPLNVTFGLSLTQIIDVDERNQILTTNCWLNQVWMDYSLQWEPKDYENITAVRIPHEKLWKPDIILYNNADSQYNLAILSTNVIVQYTGNLTWLSTAIFKSSCQINVEFFPFDEQECTMKFASWTYDGFQLNLVILSEEGDLSNYVQNGEWDLISVRVARHVVYYSCCIEPYPDITYSFVLRRRPLFYVFNLILPCVLISGLALLSFYMPSDSGEKVTLGITTLLSMTVFLMVIGESMPPTSEKLPLIGLYYGVTISLVSFATGLSVVTLNIHHRGMRGRELPSLLRKFVFNILARVLCLRLDFPKRPAPPPTHPENPTRKLAMGDTWRIVYPDLPATPPANSGCSCGTNNWQRKRQGSSLSSLGIQTPCISCFRRDQENSTLRQRPVMKIRGIPLTDDEDQFETRNVYVTQDDSSLTGRKLNVPPWERKLTGLLEQVQYTMGKNETRMEEQDRKEAIKIEWQLLALVIDRLLLWIFVFATIGATFGILYMSPHTKLFTN